MPRKVKEWVLKVDETHRARLKSEGKRFYKISTGLHWKDDVLNISGCAQVELRDYPELIREFPSEYNFKF